MSIFNTRKPNDSGISSNLRINQSGTPDFLKKTVDSMLYLGSALTPSGKDGKEIWLTKQMVNRHLLVSGMTGSGKTEFLFGIMANALSWNSGGILIDGKGDVSTAARMMGLVDKFDRRNDFYVLNFMNGHGGINDDKRSNTFNPFETMSADALTNMLVNMLEDVGEDGAMWRGRATAMFIGVVRALVWMRDDQGLYLDATVLRDHLNLRSIIDLANDAKNGLPDQIRKTIRSYLASLPGYRADRLYQQSQTTLDQHGYLEMQWSRLFSFLSDTYGHIFCAGSSDINMQDVIENRRVLLVLLPALEKSGDEIASLGRLITSAVKQMLGSTLGSAIEGSWQDVIEYRNFRHPSPFVCIFDEVGAYLTDGMDLIAAQARSLNVGLVFATQDVESLYHRNPKIAQSIVANVGTKIIMKTGVSRSEAYNFLDVFNTKHMHHKDGFSPWNALQFVAHKWTNAGALNVPLLDRVKLLGPGEFLVVQGAHAAFGKSIYVRCEPKENLRFRRCRKLLTLC
jgi:intracellular multiplication protein IcmO